jgi:hypothetical protein
MWWTLNYEYISVAKFDIIDIRYLPFDIFFKFSLSSTHTYLIYNSIKLLNYHNYPGTNLHVPHKNYADYLVKQFVEKKNSNMCYIRFKMLPNHPPNNKILKETTSESVSNRKARWWIHELFIYTPTPLKFI